MTEATVRADHEAPPPGGAGLAWEGESFLLLDQRALPFDVVWRRVDRWEELAELVRGLAVRGAPALGIAGAAAMALGARNLGLACGDEVALGELADRTRALRPTAVNLGWAVGRVLEGCRAGDPRSPAFAVARREAMRIQEEDQRANERLVHAGQTLLEPGIRALTYCHTGPIATGGHGTALGVLIEGARRGLVDHVYVPETRPLLQGARLTTWELSRADVPHTLVCDNAAGWLMATGRVDQVWVGADRIAANGDVANKIGTFPLALLAHHHGLPFYVAAAMSTVDPACRRGEEIPIELRSPEEVRHVAGRPTTAPGEAALSPAFDVTPARLIRAWVTDEGCQRPPFSRRSDRSRSAR